MKPSNTTLDTPLAGPHVWYPCTPVNAAEQARQQRVVRGKGVWLYDEQGRRYLDGISSWWVNLFGHNYPPLNQAIKEQLDCLAHTMLAGFTHPSVENLSHELAELTQHHLPYCFYASDGASAVEIALKMSVHAWRNQGKPSKNQFISLVGGYHGETLGALAVSDVAHFKHAYESLLRPSHQVMTPDSRLCTPGQTAEQRAQLALADLASLLERESEHIAALILEPLVQCAGGMAMYDVAYLKGAKLLCERYQVHLIADEIAVGCGRTGKFFACEHAGVWPDFMCLSKGITGGYLPLSVVMSSAAVYESFRDRSGDDAFLHSHSYTGNALACRAALQTLSLFRSEQVLSNNVLKANKLETALAPWYHSTAVRHGRRQGMIWAFDVNLPSGMSAAEFSTAFRVATMERELFLRPLGNTVYMMPPYCISDEEIEHLAQASYESLHAVLSQGAAC